MTASLSELGPLIDAGRTGPVTVVFANHAYRYIAANWVRAADRVGLDNYWIVALDRGVKRRLDRAAIPSVLLEYQGNLAGLWALRLHVLQTLVAAGVDIVHSDTDAVWVRNRLGAYFAGFPELDLLVSQGTVFPREVFELWGFVVCTGFFVMRANQRTKRLMDELMDRVAETGDDQVALNALLVDRGVRWSINAGHHMLHGHDQLLVSRGLSAGHGRDIRVGLLPFYEVPRLQMETGDPWVMHPLTPKVARVKRRFLQRSGLWFV